MAGCGVEKVDFVRSRARNEATEVSDRNYPLVPYSFWQAGDWTEGNGARRSINTK